MTIHRHCPPGTPACSDCPGLGADAPIYGPKACGWAITTCDSSGFCIECGHLIGQGDIAWSYSFGAGRVSAHVACIKHRARGIAIDMLEIMKP